jgi:hypothetical protein
MAFVEFVTKPLQIYVIIAVQYILILNHEQDESKYAFYPDKFVMCHNLMHLFYVIIAVQ